MRFFLLFIGFLLSSFSVFAQSSKLILQDLNELVLVGKTAFFLEDKEGSMTLEDVLKAENQARFKQGIPSSISFPSVYWLRLELNSSFLDTTQWVMTFAAQDSIEFYINDFVSNTTNFQLPDCKKSGKLIPLFRKDYPKTRTTIPAISFQLLPQKNHLIYVRLREVGQIKLTEQIKYELERGEVIAKHNLTQGLFQGFVLIMVLYNLLIFIISKDKIYGYYTLYLFCISVYFMFMTDFLLPFFFANHPWLLEFANMTGLSQFIFYSQFGMLFMNTKLHSHRWHKWLFRVNVTLYIFSIIRILSIFLYHFIAPNNEIVYHLFHFLLKIDLSLTLFMAILLAFYALSLLFVKIKLKIYFILGALSLNGGIALIITLAILGLIKSTDILIFSFELFIVLEIVAFSLGLGAKMRLDEQEKQKNQQIILQKSQENERLLQNQNIILEQKVSEKTKDLQQQNLMVQQAYEELATTNEELHQTQEEILAQRDLLENKNDLLEKYTYKIGKSIGAAKMIQKSILPQKTKMKELFDEHFVIFKPKDIVSGDFWWANEINGEKYLIVADCTGHGVSGALLTMIGSALLDRIIRLSEITKPSDILTQLHEEIKNVLQQYQTRNNEGMDIAIVHWHYEDDKCLLGFAAAKRPLYYSNSGVIEKIKGSCRHIGGASNDGRQFENKSFVLDKGTCIYLSSDGFADQNNVERTSFSQLRLINTLQEHHTLSMEEQKKVLKTQLASHMEGTEQRDDILIIGVRL